MPRRRFKIFGKWSIPAWVLVGIALFLFAVDTFQRADWLISIRKSPALQAVATWVSSPLGSTLIFAVGVLWLTVLVFSSVDVDDTEAIAEKVNMADPPKPSAVAPATVVTALDAAPNIIVVESSLRRLTLVAGKVDEDPRSETQAAVVCFRNDAVRGRQVGEMTATKAHLRFEAAGVTVLNVDAGCWLGQEYNTVDFSPGDTHTLVIGVQAHIVDPPEIRIDVPDDRRVDTETWLDIRWKTLRSDFVVVHVKLVGGWPTTHVFEFDFFLSTKPFKIEKSAEVEEIA